MAARKTRAFGYRGGVHIEGTSIACDAAGRVGDAVFLSSAEVAGLPAALGRGAFRRAGRRVLATETTLALLGRTGAALRKHALPVGFARPFVLGEARVEILPSGVLPGSASLLCEIRGRRVLYAGAVRPGAPALGATACEVRAADAVCLDATLGDPRLGLPAPAEALERVMAFVRAALADGRSPVLLAAPWGGAVDLAAHLVAGGIKVRGHRSIVAVASAFRGAGAPAPVVGRFQGRLGDGEALLWPAADGPAVPGGLARPAIALVSGAAAEPESVARTGAETGIALATRAGHADLLAYLASTGAREVAVCGRGAGPLAEDLLRRGCDHAYALGPPSQMPLFA